MKKSAKINVPKRELKTKKPLLNDVTQKKPLNGVDSMQKKLAKGKPLNGVDSMQKKLEKGNPFIGAKSSKTPMSKNSAIKDLLKKKKK